MKKEKPLLMVAENNKKRKKSFKKGQGKSKRTKKAKVAKRKQPTKAKGQCFHCGKDGHWKRNCKTFLAKKAKMKLEEASGLFMIDLCFSVNMDGAWVLDIRCTSHVYNMLQVLKTHRMLAEGEVDLRMGNGARVAAVAVATFALWPILKSTSPLANIYIFPAPVTYYRHEMHIRYLIPMHYPCLLKNISLS